LEEVEVEALKQTVKKNIISKKDSKDARLMLIRQIVIIPLRFARSLVILPLLPPSLIFTLKVISTWFSYLPRLTLGTLSVLGFYYPSAEARGDIETCERYDYMAWKFTFFSAIFGSILGLSISVFYLDYQYLFLLLVWGIFVVPMSFILSSLQAKGHFKIIAIMDTIGAIAYFVIPLIGLYFFELWGYIAGLVISMCVSIYIGREMLFPKRISLPKKFLKTNIFKGLNLWGNGFLSDLVKSYEVTLFVFIAAISTDFAGQYAVAMTLTLVVDQMITSISSVFQRKVVKDLSKEGSERKEYDIIYDFAILDFSVFIIIASLGLASIHLLVHFLPAYSELPYILPFLLLGNFLLRFRFYPGVIFKSDNEFFNIHVGHVIHLLLGVVSLSAITFVSSKMHLVALSQVIGAIGGSLFVWGMLFYQKKCFNALHFAFKAMALLTLLMIWFVFYYFTIDLIRINISLSILGGSGILILGFVLFNGSFVMLKDIVRKKLHKPGF
jgi:O-antigen/teichoic acid export membrane protein